MDSCSGPEEERGEVQEDATQAGKVWMDHGALGYHECVADDVKYGKPLHFLRA